MIDKPQEIPDAEFERIIERVAAIDVAKGSGMVCIRIPDDAAPGRRFCGVWEVAATTRAVSELADDLARQCIEKITVESTSDYWRIWFYLLEAEGLDVQLVNARDVKNVPGRPNADFQTTLGTPGSGELVVEFAVVPPGDLDVVGEFGVAEYG